MLYAKVVLGLPVEGPFDYSIPQSMYEKIKVGMRVWVPFRTRRMVGYAVKLTKETSIKNIKPISEIIDGSPALDKKMLSLTRMVSNYYGCSWGEAIETALPEGLRIGKLLPKIDKPSRITAPECSGSVVFKGNTSELSNNRILLVHDLDKTSRWEIYTQEIKNTLSQNKSVIVLLPDKDSVIKTKEIIKSRIGCSPGILYRQQSQELREWANVKSGIFNIIIGTRSGIFAPVSNLGLVIIDEEQDTVYKQEQVPHYHAREVAFIRINIEKAKLLLGSIMPSLESYYLTKKDKINPSPTLRIDGERSRTINPSTMLRIDGESFDYAQDGSPKDGELVEPRSRTIKYVFLPKKRDLPEIKIIDTRNIASNLKQRKTFFTKYLEDGIIHVLETKGKILLFLNRRGFATFATCRHCGIVLKCPRCNINLVHHFKENILNCHYCNFKMQPPQICPTCHSGYIRYLGTGTERIESELSRIFPQARIRRLDNPKELDIENGDIFISTKSIIKETNYNFDLIGVLSIDNSLNRIDFRSTEKTFSLLAGLLGLTEKKILIQTNMPNHYCFRAIEHKDINMFYTEELKQRKQLMFPPYQHLCLIKLRGKKENRVKEISNTLFKKLNKYNVNNKTIKIISVSPGEPSKLRSNFYWQILIRGASPLRIVKFLKLHLKNFLHSGIIITLDVDPL